MDKDIKYSYPECKGDVIFEDKSAARDRLHVGRALRNWRGMGRF
jgi:hypothetical protein